MTGGALAADWQIRAHGCPGPNRTDALHRDDDGTLWVGCGTAAEGYGLYVSADGGDSWSAAPVSPADKLNKFRVSSISRGSDGELRVAGFNADTREMVLSLDTGSQPFVVTPFLVGVPQVGRQFHVGTYAELTNGKGIAESLNGVDLLYRDPDTATSSASTWIAYSPGSQILDMSAGFGRFWGVGGSIAETPKRFLPPAVNSTTPYLFTVETWPGTDWKGELWGYAGENVGGIIRHVAVGVDQDANIGKLLLRNPNHEHSMSEIIGNPDAKTWGRGVCSRGDTIVAVGERQPLGAHTGLVLRSSDGGAKFTDITPADVTASASKCVIAPNGTLIVAGANGFIGILPGDPLIFAAGFEEDSL
ncbi:MAG: hypothetical protein KDI75_00075 [Xanthomonadales bacterium]|nr:hypothetical protein [Xanthomonadales bacterium]